MTCEWARDEKQLASLGEAFRSCFPDFTWKPGTYAGWNGFKKYEEKDFERIEIVDNQLSGRIEITFERDCWTMPCFNENHPGILDAKPAASPADEYDDDDD